MGSKNEVRDLNPFPGLRPFSPGESDLFFGREKESREVLGKLLENRFITVMGASGSGKSSLVYCGVLPGILGNGHEKTVKWRVIIFRPGNDPFGNLAEAIEEYLVKNSMPDPGISNIMKDLLVAPDSMEITINKYLKKGNEKILLVIDQFEELFRYSAIKARGEGDTNPAGFVGNVVPAVNRPESGIYTIIAMRSDFIGECAHYQGLTRLINSSNYLVPHMDRENYRQVIEGPVKYRGAGIEANLVEKILDDIGDRTDQLPVLQHAMMRTWAYWQELDERDRPLGFSDYESVGTLAHAMSRHANEAFEELDQQGREICERMFKTITEKGADNKGIRHPSSIKTIKNIVGCSSGQLMNVIERFRIPSRSFLMPREDIKLNDDSIIDLSHESLMRLWDRLKEWVDGESASVNMYLRLAGASAMFQRGKTSLLRPPDLHLAINWRDQHKPSLAWAERYDPAFERAMVYLRASEKEYLDGEENKIRLQKRQMRRARIVAMILGTAAIISLGFMLFAFIQRVAAEKQKNLAELSRKEESKQRHIADSNAVEADLQRRMADSSAALARLREQEAVQQMLIAENQRRLAVRNSEEARFQRGIAEIQADSAKRASLRATRSEESALAQKNEALRLRMLSIGKSMSIKSIQVQGQKDLQTLLAYQAYLFNKKNGGFENDADIYNGLFNVARQYNYTNYKTYKGHRSDIKSIAFIPGKNEFFTADGDGQVLKWNTDGQANTYQVLLSGTEIIEVLAVSPDASWLACGSSNASIKMIPLKENSIQYDLYGHTKEIKSLIFSFDGKYLYSASLDGKVLKWDLATRTSTNITTGEKEIISIDISSNGKMIAGISRDRNVIVWNPDSGSENFSIPTAGKDIKIIRFLPGENKIALGDISGNVELWDVSTRKKISEVKAHSAQVNDIRFNPSYRQMATASNDNTLKIFNISDITDLTEPPITISDHEDFVLVMQFSPDGQLVVSGAFGYRGPGNLISRPAHVDNLVKDVCTLVTRNMTRDEWNTYVGKDIPPENTCPEKDYSIKVNVVK